MLLFFNFEEIFYIMIFIIFFRIFNLMYCLFIKDDENRYNIDYIFYCLDKLLMLVCKFN